MYTEVVSGWWIVDSAGRDGGARRRWRQTLRAKPFKAVSTAKLARRACVCEATVGRLRSAYRGEGATFEPSPEGLRLSVSLSTYANPPGRWGVLAR